MIAQVSVVNCLSVSLFVDYCQFFVVKFCLQCRCLQCFDTIGWAAGRASGLWKNLSGGMLAWLSVWSEVQTCIWPSWCHCHSLSLASVKKNHIGFTFLVSAHPGSPRKRAVKRVCVCHSCEVTLCDPGVSIFLLSLVRSHSYDSCPSCLSLDTPFHKI